MNKKFYEQDTLLVAKNLLGKVLVRKEKDKIYKGIIVETEAYLGVEDKACHSYKGKKTKRTKTMYEDAGTIYIFLIYGMYNLLNIVTRKKSIPEAVLIRAVEPISSLNDISLNRYGKVYKDLNNYQKKNLTNGPGKLTEAFNIDKNLNGQNIINNMHIEIKDYGYKNIPVKTSKRIGVEYAEEAADYNYRFYIEGNKYVSKSK